MINQQTKLNYEIFGYKKNINKNINHILLSKCIHGWKQQINYNRNNNSDKYNNYIKNLKTQISTLNKKININNNTINEYKIN